MHSVRNLRKTSQTADGNIQSASITCWKALRAKNTSLRMDRSVKPFLMWWIMQSGTLSASETATLGLQHHGQFRDRRIGFFQHLALCVTSPNCIYSSHFDVTPSLSRRTHVTLLSVSRFFAAVRLLFAKQTIGSFICLKGPNRLSRTHETRFTQQEPTVTKTIFMT